MTDTTPIYEIRKSSWWPFAQRLRDYYYREHPIGQMASIARRAYRELLADGYEGQQPPADHPAFRRYQGAMQMITEGLLQAQSGIQLVEHRDKYLFRVLEPNNFFATHYQSFAGVTLVNTLVIENSRLDWFDKQLANKRFWLYPILIPDDLPELMELPDGEQASSG